MKKDDVDKLIASLGSVIDVMWKDRRPKTGQADLTAEEVKARLRTLADVFFDAQEMKEKMTPVIHAFLRDFSKEDEKSTEKAIARFWPELNAHDESHALMNLQVHLVMAGPFHKLNEDIIAKIMDEQQIVTIAAIEYLFWRSNKVREEQGQH